MPHASPQLDRLARRKYGISGSTLLRKLEKAESGGRKNAVSSAGARGWMQFMPGSRQAAINAGFGDPWRSRDEAYHAAAAHLLGKLGHRQGLEGYNPGGGAAYVRYVLGTAPIGRDAPTGDRVTVDAGAALPDSPDGAPQADFSSGSVLAASLLAKQRQVPQVPASAPPPVAHDARAVNAAMPAGYRPPQAQPVSPPSQNDELSQTLAQAALTRGGGISQPGQPGQSADDLVVEPTGSTGPVIDGGGFAGTERLAKSAIRVGSQLGVPVSSTKRARKFTSSGNISDHWIGNKQSYAVDFDTPGIDHPTGHKLARQLARRFGVTYRPNDYNSGGVVRVGNRRYKVQLLYGSAVAHGNHVHIGFKRVG